VECGQRLGLDPGIGLDRAALDLQIEGDPRSEPVEHLVERGNPPLAVRHRAHFGE